MHWLVAVRYAVFAIVLLSALIAFAAWAVRSRAVDPFSGLGRLLRSLSEPIVKPVEKKLVKNGGNPQAAAWWIFGVPLVVGLLVIAFAGWVDTQIATVMGARSARGVIRLVVSYTGWLVMIAYGVAVVAFYLMAAWRARQVATVIEIAMVERGVPPEVQLKVRLNLWLTGNLLDGLLVMLAPAP